MESGLVEEAFLKFRTRLEKLAERRMNPLLLRRISPDDVVQETMAAVSRDESPFMQNSDLPLYFRLRTALLQTLAQIERRHLGAAMRDISCEIDPGSATTSPGGIYAIADTATSPLSRITRQDRHALLHHVLAQMPDSDRAILELRHEEALGNGECAKLLGISEKAASLRYVRAIKRLKEMLGGYSEFGP